jgi:hypothetical protein
MSVGAMEGGRIEAGKWRMENLMEEKNRKAKKKKG